ncbi:MAG: hypothetical protein KAX40_11855 [Herpetosiphon sp.]|nr:hypothetical protein [Herpetosiphon sp.]
MNEIFCHGRYHVQTIAVEMRMSHWINAPIVVRISDGAVMLDLSDDVWDLCQVNEAGDTLVLVMRKYSGRTNKIELGIFPELNRYSLQGEVKTQEELLLALQAYP